MEKLKSILEQAKELAKKAEQKAAIGKLIENFSNADVVEAYNAVIPQLLEADDVEELNSKAVGTNVYEIANAMKLISGAAALWRERLGWSQGISGIGYAPILSFDGERILTASCYTPNYLGMPTEEVAKAFGEKYKTELQKIYNFLTK